MPNYIENEKFIKMLLVYRRTKNPILYNEIGKVFLEISRNKLRMPCFINYTNDRKHEMVSDAVFYMTKNLNDYNPMHAGGDVNKSNPFGYFNKIAERAFFQKIAEYKKRDAVLKPITYIENIESSALKKSNTFRHIIEIDVE